jgi:hypothetical protein
MIPCAGTDEHGSRRLRSLWLHRLSHCNARPLLSEQNIEDFLLLCSLFAAQFRTGVSPSIMSDRRGMDGLEAQPPTWTGCSPVDKSGSSISAAFRPLTSRRRRWALSSPPRLLAMRNTRDQSCTTWATVSIFDGLPLLRLSAKCAQGAICC